ncbi:MAG: hypothetical protein WCI84_06495, partial [Bacteroidota bacterium]
MRYKKVQGVLLLIFLTCQEKASNSFKNIICQGKERQKNDISYTEERNRINGCHHGVVFSAFFAK